MLNIIIYIKESGIYSLVISNLFNCFSSIPGTLSPIIDMNGTGIIGLRGYNGGILFKNYSGSDSHSIDLASGQIKLDPDTITSGTFVCRGVGKLIDNNTGLPIPTGQWNDGVTIINELINRTTIAEASQYAEAVYFDVLNGRPGTTDPIGLERDPVDNLDDAILIAASRGTNSIFLVNDYEFVNTTNVANITFIGNEDQSTNATFVAGCVVAYCNFINLRLTGNLTGITGASSCVINDLGSIGLIPSSQTLFLRDCELNGTMTLPANYSGSIIALDCYSGISNEDAVINYGNSTASLVIRDFHGNITLKNVTQTNKIDIAMGAGEIILDNSVTDAAIHFSGPAMLIDSTHAHISSGTWNTGVSIENISVSPQVITEYVWDKVLP